MSKSSSGGAYVEYFDNKSVSGAPVLAQKEMKDLNFQWGTGFVTPTQSDNVSARWYFKLIAPYTETFTFFIDADATIRFYIDGQKIYDYWFYTGTYYS